MGKKLKWLFESGEKGQKYNQQVTFVMSHFSYCHSYCGDVS